MKVTPQICRNNNNVPSFKAARVSICALSDTHGELTLANDALEFMREKKEDLFYKDKTGNTNIFTISGDWFIDGGKKGYYSDQTKQKGLFQLDILNEFISQIKRISKNTVALFTAGNHEFDGGIPLLDKILSSLNAETIITNINLKKSTGLSKSISAQKLVNQKILNVQDDKNPELKHKLLFLGITPVNLKYYQPNCNGISLINNSKLSQRKVKDSDYKKTLLDCTQRISAFKEKNPNGIVVLMNHTGVGFADKLASNAPVDIVFDGHEHKDGIRYVNGTPIVSMSQNFKKLINAKINIDDDGKLSKLDIKSFNPIRNKIQGPLLDFYESLFNKDVENIYSIKSDKCGITELSTEGIRTENNFLANFVTDSILSEIRKEQPDVDFFALNSAAIRHSLKVSDSAEVSHFDVLSVLSGIKDSDGKIMISKVSGKELLDMVFDNIYKNNTTPKKNPLIHYSGLCIDKTAILNAYKRGVKKSNFYPFIKDIRTGEPINPNKKYKIANIEKYFNKSDNAEIKRIKSKSVYLGKTAQELFERLFEQKEKNLVVSCDVRYL